MAARINKRFVLILFIVGGMTLGLLAGIWYFKIRTDVSRSVAQADTYMAQGDYRTARVYYARAVRKDPTNLQYLQSLEDALLQIQPSTADEARELYLSYVSVLRHAAVHHPADVSKHLRVLEELDRVARLTNSDMYSELMKDVAEDMLERVPAADPERIRARLYRGMAIVSPWMHNRLSAEEVAEGMTDLEKFLEEYPDSDRGWAAMINAQYAAMRRFGDAGQTIRRDEALVALRETVAEARAAVPDGPEVLTASLNVAIDEYATEPTRVDDAAVAADAARLPDLVARQDDPWLYAQAGMTLQKLYWIPDRPSGVEVIQSYMDSYPDAYHLHLFKANIQFRRGEIDDAEATARIIIESEPLTVSFLAQAQDHLRQQAQSLLVDIAMRRHGLADASERDALLETIEAERDALAQIVTDPDNDPLLIRARAQVAFVKRDYAESAALFNRLVMTGQGEDFETRLYAALSMEQQGEIGAAVQLIDDAIELRPGNRVVLMHQARLRERMGQYEESSDLIRRILDLEPAGETESAEEAGIREQALAMQERLADRISPDSTGVAAQIRLAMDKASSAFSAGEYDAARSTMLAALEKAPNSLQLLNGLVRVEITSGRPDEARVYVDRALEIAPNNSTFKVYRTNLDNSDKVAAVEEYMADVYADENRRAVETLVTMAALVLQAGEAAERHEAAGETQEAQEARDEQERARQAEAAYRAKVEQVAPNNPRYIEYRFIKALITSDWEEADRAIALAAELNVDKAAGTTFRGRYHQARGEFEEAVRSFSEAVNRIPYSAGAWRQLAVSYRELGNYPEALTAFGEAYENNPNDIETVLEYAQLLRRTGNTTRSLGIVRNARRLAPGNVPLRNLWLQVEAEGGDAAVGLRERRRIYRDNPTDLSNAAALATLLASSEPTRELLLDASGNEVYSSERWNRMDTTGPRSQQAVLARAKAEWKAEADGILDGLMPEGERDLQWHLLRAGLMRAQADTTGGIDLLRAYADEQPDGPEKLKALLALGVYQGQNGRYGAAADTFMEAKTQEASDGYLADLALGELYYRIGEHEKAVARLEAANTLKPTRSTQLMIVDSLIGLRRFDEAGPRLAVLEAETTDARTAMLRAAMALADADRQWNEGRAADAERSFEEHWVQLAKAADLAPSDTLPHIRMAAGLLAKYRHTGDKLLLDDALIELGNADEIQVDVDETSMTRIDVLEAKGDATAALAELRRVVERSSRNQAARKRLAEKLMAIGRLADARVVVEKGVELSPSSVAWRSVLGDLYVAAMRTSHRELAAMSPGDRGAAAKQAEVDRYRRLADEQYAAGLEIFTDARLIQKRAEGMLAVRPVPDARAAVDLIERYPDELGNSPTLRAVYARALAAPPLNQLDDALEQLTQAYHEIRGLIDEGKQDSSVINAWFMNLELVFASAAAGGAGPAAQFVTELTDGKLDSYENYYLAMFWVAEGRDGLSRAIELFNKAAAEFPPGDRAHEVNVWRQLSFALIRTKRFEESVGVMQKILALNPDDVNTLNNLAFVLSEPLARPVEGLPHAKRAAELAPEYEPVQDTLGWIYFKIQEYDLAERHIRRAVQTSPTAVNNLHMAAILVHNGDDGLAMRYLTKASELRPDPDTKAEIDELADDIRTRKDQGQ